VRLPSTESLNPRSLDLDRLDTGEVVARLHAEDQVALAAVGRVLPQLSQAAAAVADCLREGGRLIYVGAGTSGRLGLLDAAECPPTFGIDPSRVIAVLAGGPKAMNRAVEGAEDDRAAGRRAIAKLKVSARDLVCGISASSATPFVLGALAAARKARARTLFVGCSPTGGAIRAAQLSVVPVTGPELIAGSTRLKAGTATKLVLNALTTAAMVQLGKVYRGRMVDLRPTNAKLKRRAERMVVELSGLTAVKARRLLAQAGGSPRLALAMHFTGLDRGGAERALERHTLRELEP
jgi:N-acetylmuramic acid 6-phosphate etherase